MSNLSLYDIGQEWQQLEDALLESGGEITEELEERLGELMVAETSKINGYLAVRANLKMLAEGADAESKRLAMKKKAAENAVARMEERLLQHMLLTGKDEIVADLGKVKVQEASTPPLELVDEGIDPKAVDERYQKHSVTIDRAKLKADLQSGDEELKKQAGFFAVLGEKSKHLRVY